MTVSTLLRAAAAALALTGLVAGAAPRPAAAAGEAIALPQQSWSFAGIFGVFDRAQVQRGFQVYKEVCASCHGLYTLSFRHLAGIGFNEDYIKAIAAEYKVVDGPNDEGEMFERPARPSDKFVRPFPNEKAARVVNNGAYPPDLSLITKARADGANYVYALMTGYVEPPAGFALGDGMHYNAYFPGHQIAMPKVINADGVAYADGTQATEEQMARDVTAFLAWAAEPELEARKRMGVKVILFLLVLSGLLYAVKRRVWADVH